MTEELERVVPPPRDGRGGDAARTSTRYMTDDKTPLTFAVRIRTHPALRITAAAKMRDAVQAAAAYGGSASRRATSASTTRTGWRATAAPPAPSSRRPRRSAPERRPADGTRVLARRRRRHVLRFLDAYRFHERTRWTAIRGFCGSTSGTGTSKSRLERWNVAIVGNPKPVVGEFAFETSSRWQGDPRTARGHARPTRPTSRR